MEELTELQRKYRLWRSQQPCKNESCCTNFHHSWSVDIGPSPLPDRDVCERELAWRQYVRLRDNNPDWMPG